MLSCATSSACEGVNNPFWANVTRQTTLRSATVIFTQVLISIASATTQSAPDHILIACMCFKNLIS